MKRVWCCLISIVLIGSIIACGGDDDDHSNKQPQPLGAAGIIEGIWNGNLTSNVTGRNTGMFVIVTANGQFELITSDCAQVSANVTGDTHSFSGSGTSFTQTNCDGLNVVVVPPAPNAGPVQPFQISGLFDHKSGTAQASYSTASDNGTITFVNFYPDYFREPGILSRAAGSYSIQNRLTALNVDTNGNVVYQDAAGQNFPGTLTEMDTTVDVYRMTLQVNGQLLSGLATVVDDGNGENNDFLFIVDDGALAYSAELRRNF